MVSRSRESGVVLLICSLVGLLAAAVVIYLFVREEVPEILAKPLSLEVVNHQQAEKLTRFIFKREKGDRLTRLDVTLDLENVVRDVDTDPEPKDEEPFVQLATTQCRRARGDMGRVSFFIYGLVGRTSRNELAINNGRVYLRGLYDVTVIRDRDSQPTFCWADLEAVSPQQ